MNALSNRTYQTDHMLYKSDCVGRVFRVVEGASEGNVLKDFKLGNTRIKICDDYCYDKTPEAVQTILDRIALRAQEQLASQQPYLNGHPNST